MTRRPRILLSLCLISIAALIYFETHAGQVLLSKHAMRSGSLPIDGNYLGVPLMVVPWAFLLPLAPGFRSARSNILVKRVQKEQMIPRESAANCFCPELRAYG